jgi:hypothetical protein
MKVTGLSLVVLMTASAVTSLAHSHHSFSLYNGTQTVVYTGVVVRVNPDANHMQIFFAPLNDQRNAVIRGADGKPEIWMVEMGTAAVEAKTGVTVQNFPPGTIFSAGAFPGRADPHIGSRLHWGLYRCPPKTPPARGKYCDSVPGSVAHGPGILPKPGKLEKEFKPDYKPAP